MNEVRNWLETMFLRDNHHKYRHLCKEWLDKLLPSQIDGFRQQMVRYNNNKQL